MIGIDKYAYASNISTIAVANKLRYAGIPLIICIIFNSNIISILTIIGMALGSILLGKCKIKVYLKQNIIPFTFIFTGIITILINQVDYNDIDVIFSIKIFGAFYGISYTSIKLGLKLFLKAYACISCMYFFSMNTPINSFLSYLKKIKIPQLFIELMELIYRFIFVLGDEANKIYIAQNSRLGYQSFKSSLKCLGELVTSVFIKALKRVDKVSISVESRGFDGEFEYMLEKEEESKQLNWCTVILSTLLVIIGISERLM